MSDTDETEVAAAASAGASAAVNAVQDQQALEETAEQAEIAAVVSADMAADAAQTASEAASAASTAGSIAVDASEQAETAAQIAMATAADIERLDTRINDIDSRHSQFVEEARQFFRRLEEDNSNDGVQQVEVTTNAAPSNTDNANQAATETGSRNGNSGVPSRKRLARGRRN